MRDTKCRETFERMLLRVLVFAVLASAPATTRAASLVGTQSANGATLQLGVGAGFDGPGSAAGIDVFTVNASDLALPILGPTAIAASGPVATSPFSSSKPGDVAMIDASLEFAFGTPIGGAPNDTLSLSVSGTVSAFDAHNSAGNPADAVVGALGTVDFFVDPFLFPPGALAGAFLLPDLRPLDVAAGETLLQITVFEASPSTGFVPTPIATLTPGDSGISVPAISGNAYSVSFNYEAMAPFGTDPSFSFDYKVTLLAVPEPTTGGMLALALVCGGGIAALRWWGGGDVETQT